MYFCCYLAFCLVADKTRITSDWFLDLALEFFLVRNTPPQSDPGSAMDQENTSTSLWLNDPPCKTEQIIWRVLHPPSRVGKITQVGLYLHMKREIES